MSITSYRSRGAKLAGMPANSSIKGFVKSGKASATIQFGYAVCRGASDGICAPGGTGKILGIALRDHGQGMNESSEGQYEQYSDVSIIDKDFVVATVDAAGAIGDLVYFDTATGILAVTATPSATNRKIGRLAQTVTAAGLAVIYVDSDLESDSAPIDATGLTLTAGDTEIQADWTDPGDYNVAAIDVTCFEVSGTDLIFVSRVRVAIGDGTYTFTGLTNGTEYTVLVQAVGDNGLISSGVSASDTPAE